MNGPHDMGGMMGFGPIDPETDEPVFHSKWETRVFALVLASGATESWPSNRPWRESLPALKYWSSSYYEIWFEALLKLLIERDLVNGNEAATGHAQVAAKPVRGVLAGAKVSTLLAEGGPKNRPSDATQKFAVGDKIRTRNINPDSHTRLPRYARGRMGEIVRVHGTFIFPDSQTRELGDDPKWLYTVSFTARELWGKETMNSVCIDMWEPYLEPA